MGIEKLTDRELDHLHEKCQRMSRATQRLMKKAAAERRARDSRTKGAAQKPSKAPARRARS